MILWRRPAERHRGRRRRRVARRAEAARLIVAIDPRGTARCSGQLHHEDAGTFGRAVASTTAEPLRIDLGGVTSADATGVQLLVALRRAERGRGRTVELLNVPPSLAQVLRIAELADAFDADHSRAVADPFAVR